MYPYAQFAIVPGHNAADQGAQNSGLSISEWPTTLFLAQAIETAAEGSGIEATIYSRPDEGLSALIEDLNHKHPHGVLSLHFNAAEGKAARDHGYAVIYDDQNERTAALAHQISAHVHSPGGTRVAKRERSDLAILRDTEMPVVLDEPCFIDSTERFREAMRELDLLAHSYVKALENWAVRWAGL